MTIQANAQHLPGLELAWAELHAAGYQPGDAPHKILAQAIAAASANPDCDRSACGDFSPGPCDNPDCPSRRDNPGPAVNQQLTTAARDVLAERERQITAEGYDSGHDDMATRGQLAIAAGCYAIWSGHPVLMGGFPWKRFFPWDWKYWKPSTPRRNLIKAGALILAEIERLDRAEQAKQQEQQP